MSQAIKTQIQTIHELAQKAFKDHRITRIGVGLWKCRNPKASAYWFDIAMLDNLLIVHADMGFLALCFRHWADIERLCGDIDSLAKFVPREIPVRRWDEDVVREWIEQERTTEDGIGEDLAEELLCKLDDSQADFELALRDSDWWDGTEWPDFSNWTPNYLWCREALLWFLENEGVSHG